MKEIIKEYPFNTNELNKNNISNTERYNNTNKNNIGFQSLVCNKYNNNNDTDSWNKYLKKNELNQWEKRK